MPNPKNFRDKIFKRKSASHGYLFSGPKGAGKLEAALEFAKNIRDEKDLSNGADINLNLVVISPEIEEKAGKTRELDIKVKHIREIIKKISLTSPGSRKKTVIIKNAEKMTVAAQNALLKTLEEPPENSTLILIANDKSRLLPTVVSRCQKINFNSISDDKSSSFLENNREFFCRIIEGDMEEKLKLAEELGKNVPEALLRIEALTFFLRKKIVGGKISQNFPRISQADSLELYQDLEKSRGFLEETNANARLVLENLFLKIK